MHENGMHGEQIRYIIDLRTCVVGVQERGRMRGVGPSRGDKSLKRFSTTRCPSLLQCGVAQADAN